MNMELSFWEKRQQEDKAIASIIVPKERLRLAFIEAYQNWVSCDEAYAVKETMWQLYIEARDRFLNCKADS